MKLHLWPNRFRILSILLVASIFLQIDKVFLSPWSFNFGELSVILSYPLYLSDILLIILFTLSLVHLKKKFMVSKWIIGLLLLTILSFLFNIDGLLGLNIYWLVKIVELYVLHETIKNLFYHDLIKPRDFLVSFVCLSIFESILAIIQFGIQSDIALRFIGEPSLSAVNFGISKVNANFGLFIRSYGTFPHPNVLATFLLSGIILSFYLSDKFTNIWSKTLINLSISIQIFSLITTFSKSALIGFLLSLIILTFFLLFKTKITYFSKKDLIFSALSLITAVIILFSILNSRSFSNEPNSYNLRSIYTETALRMIKNNAYFGLGAGESMLHMERHSPVKLASWDVQPVHNYYLLTAAELGVGYALTIIAFFAWVLNKTFSLLKLNFATDPLLTLTIFTLLTCFFLLMLVDHYFYTLQQSRFLLWMVLGLASAMILKNKELRPSVPRET